MTAAIGVHSFAKKSSITLMWGNLGSGVKFCMIFNTSSNPNMSTEIISLSQNLCSQDRRYDLAYFMTNPKTMIFCIKFLVFFLIREVSAWKMGLTFSISRNVQVVIAGKLSKSWTSTQTLMKMGKKQSCITVSKLQLSLPVTDTVSNTTTSITVVTVTTNNNLWTWCYHKYLTTNHNTVMISLPKSHGWWTSNK